VRFFFFHSVRLVCCSTDEWCGFEKKEEN